MSMSIRSVDLSSINMARYPFPLETQEGKEDEKKIEERKFEFRNVAQEGGIQTVINYIKNNSDNKLMELTAYFDCLSQLYNMPNQGLLKRDNCISALKFEIYHFSKQKDQREFALQCIKNPEIIENESLKKTVEKVEYLIKQTYCDQNAWNCCFRNTKFSHHLSKIYGHPGSTKVTAGQAFFASVATGFIASGSALVATSPAPFNFALGIPIMCFGSAIVIGTVMSAALAAKREDP